jgi:hypothetical protein
MAQQMALAVSELRQDVSTARQHSSPGTKARLARYYDTLLPALIAMGRAGCDNPATGPMAASPSECVQDVFDSMNSIILQTIAAPDWKQGYMSAVAQLLARNLGICCEIIFAAVAGWVKCWNHGVEECTECQVVDDNGRVQNKSACWMEVDMIANIALLFGGIPIAVRRDEGSLYLFSWRFERQGAPDCVLSLKLFKEAADAMLLVPFLLPDELHGSAPNLRAVACVSSPLGAAIDFNEAVKAALRETAAQANTVRWDVSGRELEREPEPECDHRSPEERARAAVLALQLKTAGERIAAMQAELEIGLVQGWSVEGFDPAAEVVEDPVQWLWMRFSDGERVSRAQYTALSAMVGWSEVTDDEWVKDMRTSGGDPIHGLDRPAFEKIYEYEEDCAAAKDVEKVRGPKYWQTNEARKNVQSERPLTHQQNEVKNRVMLRINPALRATPYAYVCSLFAAFAVKLTRSAVHRLGQLHHADRRCKVSACRRI